MNIDFQNTDKLLLVKQLFERFNFNNGNIIDMNKVNNAIQSIVIVNSDMSNVPSSVKSRFERGAKGLQADNKIYITSDVTVDEIFHEILHYITVDHKGVLLPLVESYSEDEIDQKLSSIGEEMFIRRIEQLDESMTRFITELAIPEAKVSDSYEYGANVIKEYYSLLNNKGLDPNFIISMYINGNQEEIEKFKNSFGDRFDDVLEAIERNNNIRFYVLKQSQNTNISREEVSSIVDMATDNIKVK